MSTFAVVLKKISKIYPHPDADKLELGQVEGMSFQFVVQKGLYKAGDDVVFFPIEAVLPQDLIQQQGIANFMAGKEKNRIRTAALRGQLSQGYVASVSSIKEYLKVDTLPEDLTTALEVVKYEPPEIPVQNGILVGLPEFANTPYDIEGCDLYLDIVVKMMEEKVVVTEKLEGSNMLTTLDLNKEISVCLHTKAIKNIPGQEEHHFWKIARAQSPSIIEIAQILEKDYFPGQTIAIRSEVLGPGVQNNIYNFKEHTTRIFDIEVNGKYLDFTEYQCTLTKIGASERLVPIIASNVVLKDWLAGRTLQEASRGKSVLNPDRYREGIVIKPMKEQYIIGFGRLILKQRDPLYLAKQKD
jgi:RNA ligase (TIGR02306 family)